ASAALAESARRAADRCAAGAPFAYAVRRSAFRHMTLDVDERVLIPRQETEMLPEIVLELTGGGAGVAVDVGTGSGAIALSLATEGAFECVIATDLSLDALAVARRNVELLDGALRASVELRHGSGLAPLAAERARGDRVRAIVSNPPYIAFDEMGHLPASVRDWEPTVALCCGGEGMDVTVALVRDAAELLESGGVLALEVDARRAALAAERVASDGRYHEVAVRLDLAGRERFVVARRS
ncbi:MAG TPA: HemK/PrmC family methyltransferase, partial [Gemmatimonadales bacterium]